MKCKRCGDNSDHYGKGIFCSKRCQFLYAFENKKQEIIQKTKLIRTLKRIIITKSCEKCGKEFEVERTISKEGKENIPKKEKRFCSYECACSIGGSKASEKIVIKICEVCKKKYKIKKTHQHSHSCQNSKCIVENRKHQICKHCGAKIYNNNKSGCCRKCLGKDPEYRNKLSSVMKEKVQNGNHKGWQFRNIFSYAEKFFIEVLKNNNLFDKCKVNFPIKKRDLGIDCDSNYFLDFYFPDKKVDLEIDGKQHNYEDRKQSDEIRDKALSDYGIKVIRIKWKNPKNNENKIYIKNEIQRFLEFYNDNGPVA